MAFDLDLLTAYCEQAIADFAASHPDETFYAFAIDGSFLSVNSVEAFERFKHEYQAHSGQALEPDRVGAMRMQVGDWAYHMFAEMPARAFDQGTYQHHYHLSDDEQRFSAYAAAMDLLLCRLRARDAFGPLRTAPDFHAARVEHNY